MAVKFSKKKSVLLRYIDDEDVIKKIVAIQDKKSSTITDIKYERSNIPKIAKELEQEPVVYVPATEILAEKNDVQGKEMFNFDSLRNSKSTLSKGINKIKVLSGKRPVSKQAKKVEKKSATSQRDTPRKSNESARTSKYQLRARIKQELASMKNQKADSDLEDGDDEDSWCDDSGTDDVLGDDSGPSFDTRSKGSSVMFSYAEDYFFAHKQSKSLTSNRTLSKLQLPKSDIKKMEKIYSDAAENHKKEMQAMLHNYNRLFDKWILLLNEGFSVLLYGIGSKHGVLQKFATEYLEDNLYIVVHGFFPTLSVKQILCSITEDALQHQGTFSNIYDHADFIKNYFSSGKEELYIIVHNIDGTALRGMKSQSVMSMLATTPHIHFLASVDHINSPLIWDQISFSQFNWVWYDVSTFAPYIIETSFGDSLLSERSGHLVLSSLIHVFRSLTPNGRGVFLILAKEQLEEKENNTFLGMIFHEWYQKCREAFLVNSELTMQAQLTEFKDHKLLSSRKSATGTEYLYIPVDSETLQQFVEKENL